MVGASKISDATTLGVTAPRHNPTVGRGSRASDRQVRPYVRPYCMSLVMLLATVRESNVCDKPTRFARTSKTLYTLIWAKSNGSMV